MLPNLSALRLRDVHDRGVDTGPKAGKEKASKAALTPYEKQLKKDAAAKKKAEEAASIVYKPLPTDDMADVGLRTVKEQPGPIVQSTAAERVWIRELYGDSWASVDKELKQRIIRQARKALSYKFAPIIQKALDEVREAVTVDFNEKFLKDGAPKLSWQDDVVPFLNAAHPPDWRKDAGGKWLSEAGKNERSTAAKEALRAQKLIVLTDQLAALLQPKLEEAHKDLIEDLNFPADKGVRRKARALLRHLFNRKGKDGKRRVWSQGAKSDVPKTMSDARKKWATEVVKQANYDPANPPRPPANLYLLLDVRPIEESYLPDGVEAISNEGGQWLWKFMRQLEALDISSKPNYLGDTLMATVEESSLFWDASYRLHQQKTLVSDYTEFIDSMNDMSDVPGAKDVAFSYTLGSGKFNKYLLWPSSSVGGDPTKIPASGAGAGGVGGNTAEGVIGPPDLLHRLYKLINRCPRLSEPAIFLRGVNNPLGLPHNLGRQTPQMPTVGRGYLNVTFMSTSSAEPDAYTTGMLGSFLNGSNDCCLYAITTPKGSPVLPLVLGGSKTSAYVSEQEVVFPPGLVLVFQGLNELKIGSKTSTVHFYQAALPPKIEGM